MQQLPGMHHWPLLVPWKPAMPWTLEGSQGRWLVTREGWRTEVQVNLPVGQRHVWDLLRTFIQKPSHPACQELQSKQASEVEEEGIQARQMFQLASGAGRWRQSPRAPNLGIQRKSDLPRMKNLSSTLLCTIVLIYLNASNCYIAMSLKTLYEFKFLWAVIILYMYFLICECILQVFTSVINTSNVLRHVFTNTLLLKKPHHPVAPLAFCNTHWREFLLSYSSLGMFPACSALVILKAAMLWRKAKQALSQD